MTIAPDNLIPPDSELAHLLMQWSEDQDTRTWNIANLTNELIEELVPDVPEEGTVTQKDIYKAVAKRCKGRKWNTIRRISEVARDFDAEVQEKYAQLLSFEHFKVSRRLFNEGMVPTIDYVLEWSVTGDDMKLTAGRFHTVGEVMNHFYPEETFKKTLVGYWDKTKERLYDLILIHEHDVERNKMMTAWSDLEAVVSRLDKSEKFDYNK